MTYCEVRAIAEAILSLQWQRPDAPCRATELDDLLLTDRFEAEKREDFRRKVTLAVLERLIGNPCAMGREQMALEAVLQAEALLSALYPNR